MRETIFGAKRIDARSRWKETWSFGAGAVV
jgi:hypothetical protein